LAVQPSALLGRTDTPRFTAIIAVGFPVPEDELPLKLPELDDFRPAEDGSSALARATEWIHTTCPKCGAPAEREIDTMPNWAGSSWYYIRYCDPHNDTAIADKAKLDYWLPVDWYNGGMEPTRCICCTQDSGINSCMISAL